MKFHVYTADRSNIEIKRKSNNFISTCTIACNIFKAIFLFFDKGFREIRSPLKGHVNFYGA